MDHHKAVTVVNNSKLITKIGREDKLPLYEYLVTLLSRNPGIVLQHVKANREWTRPQWSIYFSDLIEKNDTFVFSDVHRTITIRELETLVWRHSRWHWTTVTGHLLLVSLPKTLQNNIHLQHLRIRDNYRAGLVYDKGYRLAYDKGWHGKNRGKAATPLTHTTEEWTTGFATPLDRRVSSS